MTTTFQRACEAAYHIIREWELDFDNDAPPSEAIVRAVLEAALDRDDEGLIEEICCAMDRPGWAAHARQAIDALRLHILSQTDSEALR